MVPKLPLVLNGVTLAILGIREGERDCQIVRLCAGESDKQSCPVSLLRKTHQCSFYLLLLGILNTMCSL